MFLAWDAAIFRAIHHGLHVPALDPVMMWLSAPGAFRYPFFLLLAALFLTRRARGLLALIMFVLTITVSDQVSVKAIKPIVKRPRPSVALSDTRPLFGVRHSRSFPSVHAVNFTAAIPIIATVFPSATIPAIVVAVLVSFSRVYVGDHWPSDVVGGALLGLMIGFLGRIAFLRLEQTISGRRRRLPERPLGEQERASGELVGSGVTGAGEGSSAFR
jgi:undecaprenyl-diphosphatase